MRLNVPVPDPSVANKADGQHESAWAHVSGSALYSDEIALPAGSLLLYPVLSDVAHGRLRSLDCSLAAQADGVHAVLSARDIPGENDTGPIVHDEVLLPTTTISYHGQAVAWILAETEAQAQHAASLVQMQIDPLPAILNIAEAIAADSYHGKTQRIERGDCEAAFARCAHQVQGSLECGEQDHFYLETHASSASMDADGTLHVVASTQHPSETQHIIARVLGLPYNQIKVSCLRMGGGFGGKETQANAFAALAALAARMSDRSVRVKLKREHDMKLTGKRHAFAMRYRLGFSSDGVIEALEAELIADAGWSLDLSPPVLMRAMVHVDNAYYLPNVSITGKLARTNKTSATAFRGFGGPQGVLLAEELIEHIARHLGKAAADIREKNFYASARNTTHYGQTLSATDLPAEGPSRMLTLWRKLLQDSRYQERAAAIAAQPRTGYKRRGIAVTPVKFGISFNKVQYNQAGALVLIYSDGSVQINHGGTEMGQGLHTKMRAVASRTLGISPEHIRVMPTSTDKVPNTSATAASSGADLNGQAVKAACDTLLQRLFAVVRAALDVSEALPLHAADNAIYSDDGKRMSFTQAVQAAYAARVSLSATGYYATPGLQWDIERNQGNPFYYFSYGAALSEVEVDGLTGEFKLLAVDILHDVGDSLNASIDRGQIEGAFVQGFGWLTMEELVWDAAGKLKTFAPSTYKIPTICEIPKHFRTQLLQHAPQPGTIYGSKAVGEPPLMLAISVRCALKAAIAAFAPQRQAAQQSALTLACPATPEAILRAVASVQHSSY
jgi:xanthine dehydrogenase large subunit